MQRIWSPWRLDYILAKRPAAASFVTSLPNATIRTI